MENYFLTLDTGIVFGRLMPKSFRIAVRMSRMWNAYRIGLMAEFEWAMTKANRINSRVMVIDLQKIATRFKQCSGNHEITKTSTMSEMLIVARISRLSSTRGQLWCEANESVSWQQDVGGRFKIASFFSCKKLFKWIKNRHQIS